MEGEVGEVGEDEGVEEAEVNGRAGMMRDRCCYICCNC